MPRYDLKCEHCGHEFEAEHAMSEPHPDVCPKCGVKDHLAVQFNSVPLLPDTYSPMAPRRGRGRGIKNKSKL